MNERNRWVITPAHLNAEVQRPEGRDRGSSTNEEVVRGESAAGISPFMRQLAAKINGRDHG